MSDQFRLVSPFQPQGDQVRAIESLVRGLSAGQREQVLLGVTGSGKTFTVARVIEAINRPTLVLSHNKTLAAQLYQEFKTFFPDNAVEYFVSYYDYYQPEAYVPQSDTYIEKDASINDEIDRLRLKATQSLFERRDVLIVASVSCIYGIGAPEVYYSMLYFFEEGREQPLGEVLASLVSMQYERTPYDLYRGAFRLRGDTLEIFPAYEETALRVEFFGDTIEAIQRIDPVRGTAIQREKKVSIFPKTHYVTPQDQIHKAVKSIRDELAIRLKDLEAQDKLVEKQRLEERTRYDLDMLTQVGHCPGIENYSRHLTGRNPGEPPPTLLDYLPSDFLLVVDESHQTIPQVRGMYNGDRSRKQTLVDFGFRLPSALDNRPLTFEEFIKRVGDTIYVSATPGPYELERAGGQVVEQVIRPTGLLDPIMEVRPTKGQVDDLYDVILECVGRNERIMVTTLTKRMAEDLTEHYREMGLKCRYLHSDIDTLERIAILSDFRRGEFDILIGINLLREGLDLPEVSTVAILDADREGFLRSETSLIQIAGRAARNLGGKVILYADTITRSMRRAMEETERRRTIQEAYNREHNIEPASIIKDVNSELVRMSNLDYFDTPSTGEVREYQDGESLLKAIKRLEKEMKEAAARWEFEKAAELRDRLRELKAMQVFS
ncbi:MAG TPA: excinuclease ABC subunit UvrB [Thermoanaerobaculia bacterium]|nr:excinuclease ABC subunit UvrB [Thermoanaerobaculia bacterium]HUM30084.1 excinuclease ABC subunit UvrB [Thermoanaerobaculia bacterium]HXK68781.1 excinuclease ABC subunit UvrB [Thermoanaerobaculia bacterium]